MSKDYYEFEKENGDVGFLAGVVDVLSDNLSMMCDSVYAMEADIFFAENNDFSALSRAVQNRFRSYNNSDFRVDDEQIDAINFSSEDYEKTTIDALHKMFAKYSSNAQLDKNIDEFFQSLNWYLGKPACCYVPKNRNDNNAVLFGNVYLYEAFDYLFIAYDSFFVLFVFGTVE
ncbi:MAG: hypothetical protein K2G45_06700 [Lachnospiraceae bacterium]|nr:hypothetical protein [Lachnospiraceae bacterium]